MNVVKNFQNILVYKRLIIPTSKLFSSLENSNRTFSILSIHSPHPHILTKTENVAPRTNWLLNFVRTKIRENFPIPKENIRVKVGGWKTKIKTKGGRAQIMRRILKGRHVLTH
uniref:Uncharacterized protein n=1 Tax=Clastoptera arizonana TaxID=38151 RepID=A0A1B6DFW3_9HEMI